MAKLLTRVGGVEEVMNFSSSCLSIELDYLFEVYNFLCVCYPCWGI